MSTLRFSAHCERGHDPVDFTDPKAFEAHMMGEHKARKRSGGGPAWCSPKPYPWVAPKAPATTEKLTAALVKWDNNGHNVKWGQGGVLEFETPDRIAPAALEAGDVFRIGGHEYAVLEADAERGYRVGFHNRPDRTESKWMTAETIATQAERIAADARVIRLGRAA